MSYRFIILFQVICLFQNYLNHIQASFLVSRKYLLNSSSSVNPGERLQFFPTKRSLDGENDAFSSSSSKSDKFSLNQRFESIKSGIVGLLAGGIAVTPFTALHDLVLFPYMKILPINSMAQFEFDTDTASLQGALFAIVYRYCVRQGEKEENEMLAMGVLGAFVLVRTLSRLSIPTYCTAIPLNCKWISKSVVLLNYGYMFLMIDSLFLTLLYHSLIQ